MGLLFIMLLLDGEQKVVSILLKHNANVHAKNKYGETPLRLASLYRRTKVVLILLKHKANVDAEDRHGRTPLDYASRSGKTEIVSILRKHKAMKKAH